MTNSAIVRFIKNYGIISVIILLIIWKAIANVNAGLDNGKPVVSPGCDLNLKMGASLHLGDEPYFVSDLWNYESKGQVHVEFTKVNK